MLAPYRTSARMVLEIGLLGGLSLLMWEEYFQNAEVHGIDLTDQPLDGRFDLRPLIAAGHRIHLLDASDPEQVESHFSGMLFDVIIEDAQHYLEQQVAIYLAFRDHLAPGAIYIIEDVANIESSRTIFESLDSTKQTEIVDLRETKGRFDDVLVTLIDKP
jgi:hypothetical protein